MSSHVLTLFTPIVKAIKKGFAWYEAKQDKKKWDQLRSEELAKLDNKQHSWYPVLVDNLLKNIQLQKTFDKTAQNEPAYLELLFKVGCKAARELRVLLNIVGLQPLQGPVGLVYHMEYSEKKTEQTDVYPNSNLRLEIVSHTTYAEAKELAPRVDFQVFKENMNNREFVDSFVEALGTEIALENIAEVLSDLHTLARSNPDHIEEITCRDSEKGLMVFKVCNEIASSTRRGTGNFIITSIETAAMLQSLPFSKFVAAGNHHESNYGLTYKGTLNETIKVYTAPEIEPSTVLVGYMGGNGSTDTGYVYSPYLPAITTGVVIDPVSFNPLITFFSRYGKSVFDKKPNGSDKQLSSGEKYYRVIKFVEPTKVEYDPTSLTEDFYISSSYLESETTAMLATIEKFTENAEQIRQKYVDAAADPNMTYDTFLSTLDESPVKGVTQSDDPVEFKSSLPDSIELNDKPFV